jgi:hypothetical protein
MQIWYAQAEAYGKVFGEMNMCEEMKGNISTIDPYKLKEKIANIFTLIVKLSKHPLFIRTYTWMKC